MRQVVLGLSAFAAAMALAVSGASATVLCETAASPCKAVYPTKTAIEADLTSKWSLFELTTPKTVEYSGCTTETMRAEVTQAGGLFSTVVAPVTEIKFSECAGVPKTVVKSGTLEIHHINGTHNGTVTLDGAEFTFDHAGIDCKWVASNAVLGTLTGGSDPVLNVNVSLAPASLCYPEQVFQWTATFTLTAPSPLYVEPS